MATVETLPPTRRKRGRRRRRKSGFFFLFLFFYDSDAALWTNRPLAVPSHFDIVELDGGSKCFQELLLFSLVSAKSHVSLVAKEGEEHIVFVSLESRQHQSKRRVHIMRSLGRQFLFFGIR